MKYLFFSFCLFALSACAENFSWQDPTTWHFKLDQQQRTLQGLKEACLKNAENNQRVVLMNGVADRVEHTECQPHTHRPLTPQRFEGR